MWYKHLPTLLFENCQADIPAHEKIFEQPYRNSSKMDCPNYPRYNVSHGIFPSWRLFEILKSTHMSRKKGGLKYVKEERDTEETIKLSVAC